MPYTYFRSTKRDSLYFLAVLWLACALQMLAQSAALFRATSRTPRAA